MRNWHAFRSAFSSAALSEGAQISSGVSFARRLRGYNPRRCPVISAPRGKSPPRKQRGGGSLARPPTGLAMLSDEPQATGRSAAAGGALSAEQ